MDGNGTWGCDSEFDLIATNSHDGDSDIVANDDFLVELAGQNEHGRLRTIRMPKGLPRFNRVTIASFENFSQRSAMLRERVTQLS
jgi:hypothetical protein